MAAFLLLLLPALALARIDVEVTGKYGEGDMKVYISGSETDLISSEDRKSFNLGDASLKRAVQAYFGATPTDAYLRSPTPWNDLYSSYGWSQVQRTCIPKASRVLRVTSEPQIVMQQVFENNSSKAGIFNVGIHQDVQNYVSSSWSESQELIVNHDIKYDFNILSIEGHGSAGFSYTSKYGRDYKKSQTVTVGSTSALEIQLLPGQSAVATLQANRGTIVVEVEYETSLSGAVAVNYEKTYKGHHFWALDVDAVMNSGGLNNNVSAKELIEIGFYANSKVVVNDKKHGNRIMHVDF